MLNFNRAWRDGSHMQMDVAEADGITLVKLDGRFDIAGAQAVDLRFSALSGSCAALVVDLTKVPFLASMGVRTLMLSAKTILRRGHRMAVCGPDENVEKVLRSTGFDEIVDIYPDFPSATAAWARAKA
jgi:anti-anti-sigma factor